MYCVYVRMFLWPQCRQANLRAAASLPAWLHAMEGRALARVLLHALRAAVCAACLFVCFHVMSCEACCVIFPSHLFFPWLCLFRPLAPIRPLHTRQAAWLTGWLV